MASYLHQCLPNLCHRAPLQICFNVNCTPDMQMYVQVDGSDQMRYLQHRMQHCALDEAVIAQARQLAAQRRTAAAPAMHVRPLQVHHVPVQLKTCCVGGRTL